MGDDLQVIADGTTRESTKKPERSPWILVALAFVVGLGLGIAFVAPPAEEPTEEETELAAPVVEPVPVITDSGVGELIEGFSGSIFALSDPGLGQITRLVWPDDAALLVNDVGRGSFPSLDQSGQVLASLQQVPGLDGFVLSMGRSNDIRPLTHGVTSYAWHDSASGHLSYTLEVDGEWQLWRVFTDLQPSMVAAGVVEGGQVAAWGDWGWAIQTVDSQVLLLTPLGEIKTIHPGIAFSSHGDGWVVVANERVELVSAGGGVRAVDVSTDTIGPLVAAEISPEGERIALAGTEGLLVVPVDGDGPTVEFDISSNGLLAWSTDGEFVLAPSSRGLAILDVTRGVRQTVLTSYAISDVGATP